MKLICQHRSSANQLNWLEFLCKFYRRCKLFSHWIFAAPTIRIDSVRLCFHAKSISRYILTWILHSTKQKSKRMCLQRFRPFTGLCSFNYLRLSQILSFSILVFSHSLQMWISKCEKRNSHTCLRTIIIMCAAQILVEAKCVQKMQHKDTFGLKELTVFCERILFMVVTEAKHTNGTWSNFDAKELTRIFRFSEMHNKTVCQAHFKRIKQI